MTSNNHTPFSYTPDGLDLTQIRNPLWERQMSRNAAPPSDQPQHQPIGQPVSVQSPRGGDDISPVLLRRSTSETAAPHVRSTGSTDDSEVLQPAASMCRSVSVPAPNIEGNESPVVLRRSAMESPSAAAMRHSAERRTGSTDFSHFVIPENSVLLATQLHNHVPAPSMCRSFSVPTPSIEGNESPVVLRRSALESPSSAAMRHSAERRIGFTDFSHFAIPEHPEQLATDLHHHMSLSTPSMSQSVPVPAPSDEGSESPVVLRRPAMESSSPPEVAAHRAGSADFSEDVCCSSSDQGGPNELVAEARIKFKARKRLENETQLEYACALESLTAGCEFGPAAEWIVEERVSSEFAGEPVQTNSATSTQGGDEKKEYGMSNSFTGIKAWKESAEQHQHDIQDLLFGSREYDLFEKTDFGKRLLRKKISFAIFGPPSSESYMLSDSEEKILSKVFKMLCEKNAGQNSFRISFVYIECLIRGKPSFCSVIRLHLTDKTDEKIEKSVFIDEMSRTYVDFKHYLKKNQLPKCIMCYPVTGSYYFQTKDDQLEVKFKKSPACYIINRLLKKADSASTAITKAAMAAGNAIDALFPAAAPIVVTGAWLAGGSATLYRMGRSIEKLVDRGVHGQSLSLASSAARECWMDVGSAVRIMVTADTIFEVTEVLQAPVAESMSASGLGVLNKVESIVQKYVRGQTISLMELVYLVSASLMFANVLMTTFQAKALLKEMLENGMRPDNFLKELTGSVKERPEYSKLPNPNQVMNLAPLGMFFTLPIPTVDLPTCFKATCKLVYGSAKLLALKFSGPAEHAKIIKSQVDVFWSSFGNEMQIMVEWFCQVKGKKALCEVFGDISVNDAREFVSRLLAMVSLFRNQGADKNALDRLASVIKLQEDTGAVQPEEGAEKWIEEFARICEILKNELKWQKTNYQKGFEAAKKSSSKITESEYQKAVEISGPVNEYFWEKALIQMTKDFSGRASLLKLAPGIFVITAGSSSLEDVGTGTTVHFFHGLTPGASDQQLSREQYLAVAREKVGPVLDIMACSLEIDPESRMGFFQDVPTNAEGITCVIVNCEPEEGYVAGHVFVVKCKSG